MEIKSIKYSHKLEQFEFEYKGYDVVVIFDKTNMNDQYHKVYTKIKTNKGTWINESMMLDKLGEMVVNEEWIFQGLADGCIRSYLLESSIND